MSLTYLDLRNEVKRRSTRDQSGTQFDSAIDTLLNTGLARIARETAWKVLRRKYDFETVGAYTTGTGAVSVTNDSKAVTITGATLITDGIEVGRRIDLGGSQINYIVSTITGEETLTVNVAFDGTTSSTQSYHMYGQEEYVLPAQCDRIGVVWHEDFGYPYNLEYVPESDFLTSSIDMHDGDTPVLYRQWESDWVLQQPLEPSSVAVSSSSASDTTQKVTIHGISTNGMPDSETISLSGTAPQSGNLSFTSIERVVKDASTVGQIIATTNSANVTVARMPAGDATAGIHYSKVSLYPLPTRVFPVHIWAYKKPWRLVADTDVHELGSDFDEAIILLATARLNYQQSQKEGDRFITLFADELKSLKNRNSDKYDWLPNLRRPRDSRSSRGGVHKYVSYQQLGGKYGPASRG
jgi:hypothetical protein